MNGPESTPDESVYEQLRAGIVEGRYVSGTRMVEQALASDLGVSRTPVREALRRLEADGFVVSERNRGAVVRGVSAEEVADLYELRGRLESFAAELAATRRTAEQVVDLRVAADAFSAAAEEPDGAGSTAVRALGDGGDGDGVERIRRLNVANRAFHDGVVAASRHTRLSVMLRGTVDVPLVFRALQSFDRAQLRRSAMFHHLIVDAIAGGDGPRAGRLMAEHIAQGFDMVRHLVETDVDAARRV